MNDKDLIFFYSHENCPARATALPVLAWLAEQKELEYDGYFCVKPSVADIGDTLPFTGNKHDQQFQLVANFYNHIYFFALSEEEPIQFERFLSSRKNTSLLKNRSNQLVDFYLKIFEIFDVPFPKEAVIFSSQIFPFQNEKIELGDFKIPGESRLDTFCYPEIFFRQALGLFYELNDDQFLKLISAGLKKIYLIFCPDDAKARFEKLGFKVEIIDTVQSNDNYTTLTQRIANRWLHEAKGFALGNDPITLRWTPKYLRDRILTIAAVQSLPQAVDVLGELTEQVGNKFVWGSQVFNDNIIADASKHDIIFSLVHDVEVGITIKEKISINKSWLPEAKAPWEDEVSDEFLEHQMNKGNVPVCFLNYASDLGHLPILPRHLDLHSIDGFKSGLAFPATWWQFAEEQLEQLYISKEMGGIFPSTEPMLCSAGIGAATEAEGYLSKSAYLAALKQAKEIIAKKASEKHIPNGNYSFQDARPQYKHNTAEPHFDVLLEAGFVYAFTYKNEGQFPEIVFSKGEFFVLNQQSEHWSFDPFSEVKKWEQEMITTKKPGWIAIGLDTPFWGFVPCYFGLASKGLDLTNVQKAMTYARDGGESGKLFLLKPHELVRFAKLLRTNELI